MPRDNEPVEVFGLAGLAVRTCVLDKRTEPMMGYPGLGEHNPSAAVLSESQAEDVIRRCLCPAQDELFAEWYGVSRACIQNIRLGRTWYWLRLKILDSPPNCP